MHWARNRAEKSGQESYLQICCPARLECQQTSLFTVLRHLFCSRLASCHRSKRTQARTAKVVAQLQERTNRNITAIVAQAAEHSLDPHHRHPQHGCYHTPRLHTG